ncbi:hypothetical protein D9613_006420 [Agrocybe pediades]|uniref:RTA1-domain-containing protein n=1 Tax=Agrocybe pediades TaxID=84607 RepID=A0A8H4QVS5_9AGAR|nr:hypothetical protein D9613_006420 [Agrocybe pediades]
MTVYYHDIPLTPAEIKQFSPYHYLPTRAIAIVMILLFGVATAIHLGQALKYRMYWLIPTVGLCGAGELIGWAGRLWSSIDPISRHPFEIQITCTIVAPTPFLAASFVIFGELIKRLGFQYSRLGPKWYTIIFCTCDVISLVVQGVGGGIAATANTLKGANLGAHIMLGGIGFQFLIIILFSLFALEYFYRYSRDVPVSKEVEIGSKILDSDSHSTTNIAGRYRGVITLRQKVMAYSLVFTTTLLFIRAVYRLVELSDGWHGRIIEDQLLFNVLDATMIVLAMYTVVFIHPGYFLAEQPQLESFQMVTQAPGKI